MSHVCNMSGVNCLSNEQFERVFGNVIEFCADAAVTVQKRRPFKNVDELCNAFHEYLERLNIEGKLVVLQAHPDLAARWAGRGELTRESADEQRSAGLSDLTQEQKNIIHETNRRYKEKFGFPFIICARENKVESIIEGLQKRYKNTREKEINTGIDEVKKICRLRIQDIVKEN